MKFSIVAVVATVSVGAQADHQVDKTEVPGVVLDAIQLKYPHSKQIKHERSLAKGFTVYEVTLESRGQHRALSVSLYGKIVREETALAYAKLPKVVKAGLRGSAYAKWKVKKAEKLVIQEAEDSPLYELVLSRNGELAEVRFDASGRLVKIDPADDP